MTNVEALKTIKRLESICKNAEHLEDETVKQEYVKSLLRMDYILLSSNIDQLILSGDRRVTYLPTPAELNAIYNEAEKVHKENQKAMQQEFCLVCENDGFITHTKKWDGREYEIILYCTECSKGNDFKYDGRNNSGKNNVKSEYYSEPVTKYYDVDELKAQNVFKDRKQKSMPDNIRHMMAKLGRTLRI